MVDYQVRNLLGATGIKSEPPFAPSSLLSRLMGAPSGVMRPPPSHHHQLKDRSSEEEDKDRDAGKEVVSANKSVFSELWRCFGTRDRIGPEGSLRSWESGRIEQECDS